MNDSISRPLPPEAWSAIRHFEQIGMALQRLVYRQAEQAVGLPPGALGTTHVVELDTGQVIPLPED